MTLVGKQGLYAFKRKYPDVRNQVDTMIQVIENARWKTPIDLISDYPQASNLGKNNWVFDLSGNKYRVWMQVSFNAQALLVKKIGKHSDYDSWQIS